MRRRRHYAIKPLTRHDGADLEPAGITAIIVYRYAAYRRNSAAGSMTDGHNLAKMR
jgi:hypothetical protein